MTPRKKRKHLDENTKNRITGLRQSNKTSKDILNHLQKENVETSLSTVKRIGLSYETKGFASRKPGSGHPRLSTVKDNHRLKIAVLKDRKKP